MRTPIRAVLFDAVGTLIYPDPPVVDVYFRAGRKYGSQLSREAVDERFQAAFLAEQRADLLDSDQAGARDLHRRPTSEAREQQRWSRIVGSVFENVSDPAGGLFATLWDHFADGANWRVFEDVPHALRQVEQLCPVLGIASNFDQRLVEITNRLPQLAACQHVFCSSSVGYSKPCSHFFRAIEAKLHLAPAEILLVGDDWDNDFQAALQAGWQALHLKREKDVADAREVRSLNAVIEFIEQKTY